MKIYTKFGDKGKTMLVSGQTVPKNHGRVETYGSVDELNSSLGIALCYINNTPLQSFISQIQNELFNLGSLLACEDEKLLKTLPQINSSHVQKIENKIDELSESLPPLKNFILPGGAKAAAYLHLARCICRRAERNLVSMTQSLESPSEHELAQLETCLIYLNRLSDFLFIAARSANQYEGQADQIWKK